MHRNTLLAWLGVCALAVAACSNAPETLLSPTSVDPATTFVNPDGSTVKVSAPGDLAPAGGSTVDTLRPTLNFGSAVGRFASAPFSYDLEVHDASQAIYQRTVSGPHTLESDLAYASTYWWRVRVRLLDQVGPWSNFAEFRTPNPPGPAAPTGGSASGGGGLPFPVPASCLAGNGASCAFEISGLSDEWARCRAGDGVGCHRFTRQVVYALSLGDPNWQMIQAAPGGHACNCFSCGPSDGTMFREDTTVYAGSEVYDMITGAGGPSPAVTWNYVGRPRNVDGPNNAPVCE